LIYLPNINIDLFYLVCVHKSKESELPADINKAKIGGLGNHIVKKLMDDIWFFRGDIYKIGFG